MSRFLSQNSKFPQITICDTLKNALVVFFLINIVDFDEYLKDFDKQIGIDKIKCIHVNDSKNPIGARKDRHENIGLGTIGFDNLINVCYNELLKDVPKILETPWIGEYPPYKQEIEMIRTKTFNPNLVDDVTKGN